MRWSQSEPLSRAEVNKLGRLEELEIDERLGGREVHDVVAVRGGEDSSVAGLYDSEVNTTKAASQRENIPGSRMYERCLIQRKP